VQAIEYYGQQEGLDSSEIHAITSDWNTIDQVNHGLYHDNHTVANDPHHYLNQADTYDTHSQNEAAHNVVLDWKAAHRMPDPTPSTAGNTAPDLPRYEFPPAVSAKSNRQLQETQHLLAILSAISIAGTSAAWIRVANRRRKMRRVAVIAKREKQGVARSHNKNIRKILDNRPQKRPATMTQMPPQTPLLQPQHLADLHIP
jgi:hypothetical protein